MAEPESQQDPTQDPQDTGGQPTPQQEQEPPADTGKDKAPWERDGGKFDPETAWKLIQNLRDENSGLKKKNREYEDAKLTEQQKAERDLAETREQIARLHGARIVADLADLRLRIRSQFQNLYVPKQFRKSHLYISP